MIEVSGLARACTYLFLVSMMLSIGLEVTGRQMLDSLRNTSLVGRALLANLVLVPLLGLLLVRLFPLSPDVATGLLILAAAPGAPFAVQFTSKAKSAVAFAAALLFLLTFLSVVVTVPLTGLLLEAEASLRLPVWRIVDRLTLYVVLPFLAGLVLQRWPGGVGAMIRRPVALLAAVAFPAAIVLTMATKSAATRAVGAPALVAMLLLVLGGMVIGWLLGGPGRDTRRVLATSTGMRNIVVALLIALNSFPGTHVNVAILAFSALMVPPNLLFTFYQDRQARKRAAEASDPGRPAGR